MCTQISIKILIFQHIFPFTITFLLFMLLTADSLRKYIQSCHNIYCFSIILFYYFQHKTLTSCSLFTVHTDCMKSSSVLILMLSTPSNVTVSIFSCKVIKKKIIGIHVQHCWPQKKSTKQSTIQNKQQRINQQNKTNF